MADTKISALPASTVPLAGTEVLPIVQSSTTKQVSVANLTAGRSVSMADATLTTGNLVIGTSGKGIDFSATSHPAGMTSELLADYEEGTWTATIEGTTTAGTASYTSQTGSYTKIGNIVAITLYIDWNTGTGTGSLAIAGLPYTSVASRYQAMTIGQLENVTKTALTTVVAQINPSVTIIRFVEIPSVGGANVGLAYDAAGNIFISGTYFV
jgi:hypothetical protein